MSSVPLVNDVARPALRYYGSKWRIAPWIIAHFPSHEVYVEPFAGGASVLLRKAASQIEIYNDLDGDLCNFFRVLREEPADLIRAIDLTPWSREEFEISLQACGEVMERARRTYVRSWQGIGGKMVYRTGWRIDKNTKRGCPMVNDWSKIDYLWQVAERLKGVQLENDDAFEVIQRMDSPTTLFYLDPPYMSSTRCHSWAKCAYAHEMTDEDHQRLGELANRLEGMVIISGYESNLYEEMFGHWHRTRKTTHGEGGKRSVEMLWISPRAQGLRQLQLI